MLQLRLFAGKTQWQGWPRRDGLGREGHSRAVHGRNGDSHVGCWSRRELRFESWEQRRLQSQRTHQLHCFLPAKKFVKKKQEIANCNDVMLLTWWRQQVECSCRYFGGRNERRTCCDVEVWRQWVHWRYREAMDAAATIHSRRSHLRPSGQSNLLSSHARTHVNIFLTNLIDFRVICFSGDHRRIFLPSTLSTMPLSWASKWWVRMRVNRFQSTFLECSSFRNR